MNAALSSSLQSWISWPSCEAQGFLLSSNDLSFPRDETGVLEWLTPRFPSVPKCHQTLLLSLPQCVMSGDREWRRVQTRHTNATQSSFYISRLENPVKTHSDSSHRLISTYERSCHKLVFHKQWKQMHPLFWHCCIAHPLNTEIISKVIFPFNSGFPLLISVHLFIQLISFSYRARHGAQALCMPGNCFTLSFVQLISLTRASIRDIRGVAYPLGTGVPGLFSWHGDGCHLPMASHCLLFRCVCVQITFPHKNTAHVESGAAWMIS